MAEAFRRAAAGDKAAWAALVDGFERMIWNVAVAHRLHHADASEVLQTTWLRLIENLGRIEQPERLGGWLATTARRESLRMLRLRGREIPHGDDGNGAEWGPSGTPAPEERVLDQERDRQLWAAFRGLDRRCQELLRLVVLTGPPYAEVASSLAMAVGSIGPTRARCLQRLRKLLDEAGAT